MQHITVGNRPLQSLPFFHEAYHAPEVYITKYIVFFKLFFIIFELILCHDLWKILCKLLILIEYILQAIVQFYKIIFIYSRFVYPETISENSRISISFRFVLYTNHCPRQHRLSVSSCVTPLRCSRFCRPIFSHILTKLIWTLPELNFSTCSDFLPFHGHWMAEQFPDICR